MVNGLRYVLGGGAGSHRRAKQEAAGVHRATTSQIRPTAQEPTVTWVGHATCLVQMAGMNILTDPNWSNRLVGTVPRLTAPGIAWDDLPNIDAIVVSHNHLDHLDGPTIRRLHPDVACLAPLGLGRWLTQRGFNTVHELDWWHSAVVEGVELTLVPAVHWSARTPWDRNRTLWGGWVAREHGGSGGVYFAGDTAYGEHFRNIGKRFPGLDVALLPVGGYAPRWWLGDVHMTPEESVRACTALGAARMTPIHWGTWRLSREPVLEPIQRTRAAWASSRRPAADLWDLGLGETRTVGASA